MTDLDTLRPEVRDAINRTDMTVEMFDTLVTVNRDDYDIIRAELLLLAQELHGTPPIEIYNEAVERAERAESELAALKARIGEAPVGVVNVDDRGCEFVSVDFAENTRVRLVVEE